MPRANRHFLPGHVWHITHRCHKKEFLLKFVRDRKRWLHWLFEAKKCFGLKVLNYIVTSNHIHLLVLDSGGEVIPKSMQLIAGRTAREYNLRKNRRGAYWEDRYHATAVETDQHLAKCIVYIDMNMIRAGIVNHPEEWQHSGYKEIQNPPERYHIIDSVGLMDLLGVSEFEQLRTLRRDWVEAALGSNQLNRESLWTEGLAVGSQDYVETIKINLGAKAHGWKTICFQR